MPRGPAKGSLNKGFAYVDFGTSEAVASAVALSEGHLDGRRLLIKDAKDYQGRPASAAAVAGEAILASATSTSYESGTQSRALGKAKSSLSKSARKLLDKQTNPPSPTLFVGNLGFETTKEMIQEAMEAHWQSNSAWQSKKDGSTRKEEKQDNGGKGKGRVDPEDGLPDSAPESMEGKTPSNTETGIARSATSTGIRKVRIGTFEDSGKCKGSVIHCQTSHSSRSFPSGLIFLAGLSSIFSLQLKPLWRS